MFGGIDCAKSIDDRIFLGLKFRNIIFKVAVDTWFTVYISFLLFAIFGETSFIIMQNYSWLCCVVLFFDQVNMGRRKCKEEFEIFHPCFSIIFTVQIWKNIIVFYLYRQQRNTQCVFLFSKIIKKCILSVYQ